MSRIAFTTITLGGSFQDKVRAMAAAGFTATEIWARDLFDHLEGPEVALDVMRDCGLRISALQAIRNLEGCSASQRARKRDIAERMLDLACLAEAPLVTLAANVQTGADGTQSHLIDDLAWLANAASARGLRIAYEAIAWAPHVDSCERALALIEAIDHPALGLQLDVFHEFIRGTQRIALERIPPARLFLVEVSDFPGSQLPPRDVSRDLRLFPGEGVAPLRPFARDLQACGYSGDVVVEIFNAAYRGLPPAEVAARAWHSMQALLEPDEH